MTISGTNAAPLTLPKLLSGSGRATATRGRAGLLFTPALLLATSVLSAIVGTAQRAAAFLVLVVLLRLFTMVFYESIEITRWGLSTLGDRGKRVISMAYAPAKLGRLGEAADACRQSLEMRRVLGQHNLAMDCLAGLARVAVAQGDMSQALSCVEEILHFLESGTLEGTEEPMYVYLTCCQVLDARQDPRGRGILEVAYKLLQERTARISDPDMRHSFLENVAAHREIAAAWEAVSR